MKYPAAELSEQTIRSATASAERRIAETLKLAEKLVADPEREQRQAGSLCKACYYFTQIGGAALTQRPCAACGENQHYGSTSTDNLCLPCALQRNLCKRCGGHTEMP